MGNVWKIIAVIIFSIPAITSFSQDNDTPPVITGQTPSPLVTQENTPITITLDNLIVTDPDPTPVYPDGFTLELNSGDNYEFSGATVTPDAGFSGTLTVRVRVDDGANNSDWFDLTIDVVAAANVAPQITGQDPISINQGESTTITLGQLNVTDPDDDYPTGFTLTVHSGSNYTFNGATITPAANFVGALTVHVSVNDGEDQSNVFDLIVNVVEPANVPPEITGQDPISINQGESTTITLAQLNVTDPDNNYPTGFTLTVHSGSNYTFNGATITPAANFVGALTVHVSVNDGEDQSNVFDLIVNVVEPANVPPQITGQDPISIDQGESTTITLAQLNVTDPDNNYPTGFTLTVHSGSNYTFNGATITPAASFVGALTVHVSVNDGEDQSNVFDLIVDVAAPQNVPPQITGQDPININQGESTTITLAQLNVTDPDDNYPTGFTLTVRSGTNYTFNGATITPAANFVGALTVHVSVNDGEDESNVFDLIVNVAAPQNVPPQITGQVPISIDQGESVTITLAQLTVTDPDDNYPTGFTLTVHSGANYTVSGATVTPTASFVGNLTVQVSVNDGEASSARFNLTIQVSELQNVVPQITGQSALSINEGESLTITLAQLTVVDPDNTYPGDFTLTVYSGTNYTIAGTTITPAANFSGTLTVPVSVNDGEDESARFDLKVEVKGVNDAPQITGQVPLSINQGQSLTIALSHLVVSDPDNTYPTGFTLTVYGGLIYTLTGNTIAAAANFTGELTVPVSVNDGQNESNKFNLIVNVLKLEPSAPQITAQKPLTTNEDVPLAIALADLTVVDADDVYPQGFTLKISSGQNYSASGSTIVPARNYFGTLSVSVQVNDGKNDSAPFQLQVTVLPVNDVPIITGQKELETDQGVPLTINLTDLNVTDPDNTFPSDFTMSLTAGANYSAAGATVTPTATFSGILNVIVTVSDGTASSAAFNLRVDVNSTATNVAPAIIGQKEISITPNTSVTLQLFHLIVNDPDNEFPADFKLKVSPGTNYTVTGTTVKPSASFTSGTLTVGVRVNDGTNDSPVFQLKIQVTPISATPRIIGQRELTMMEDSTLTITLSDLIVTDADNPDYPKGFTLKVLGDGEGVYTASGAGVTPAADLNGFIEVGVTVSDGTNTSNEFRLAILVNPVNDPPKVTLLETFALPFEPGKEPVNIFNRLTLSDIDNDYLSMAEIGFRPTNFNPRNDEILFDFDTTLIRVVRDPGGTLFLIGYATLDQYQTALRSMKYNYKITQDFNGNPDEVPSGSRTVYANVNDGQSISLSSERSINIEARIALDIPSAFTPNGDNANDTWHLVVSNKDELDQTIIKVYNKRGLLLFEADGFDSEWDGTFNGELLPVDTYYYTIVVKLPYIRQTYSGVVTILY